MSTPSHRTAGPSLSPSADSAVNSARQLHPRTAAHLYLDRGFTPIPWYIGRDKAKVVAIRGFSYADYACTHASIEQWPAAQCGLVMSKRSGFWALDFDCQQQRVDEFGSAFFVQETAAQLTGRGFHLIYRGTGGCEWPRDGVWSADWMDVQVRSNGFIAAAPSWHPNGRQYRWFDDRMPAEPSTMMLATRPERQPRPSVGGGGRRDDDLDGDLAYYAQHGIDAGWQDDTLYRLACRHVRTMDHQELAGWLWAAASHSVQDRANPWRPKDIANKIRRAAEFTSHSDAGAMRTYENMKAGRHG